MLSSILVICLILVLLGGVGFVPAPAFTPTARGIVGAVIVIFFVLWLFKWSGLLIL